MMDGSQDMSEYIDDFACLFNKLAQMGEKRTIPDEREAPFLLAAIGCESAMEPAAAALRTKEIDMLTWDYVSTALIDEYNARHIISVSQNNNPSKNKGWVLR